MNGGSSRWRVARSVLAVRLDGMGDVLMTVPAMRALKAAAPGRRLTLLTSPAGAAAARLVPEIDEIVEYEAPWVKSTPAGAEARSDLDLVQTLRASQYDAAVIFTVFTQNPLPAAMLCYLAGIPIRLAYCHENPYQLLTGWAPDPDPVAGIRHEVRRQLDLVELTGASVDAVSSRIDPQPEARERVTRLLAAVGIGEAPWAVIHPGATADSRRYPAGSYAEVARRLRKQGWQVLVVGGTQDDAAVQEIVSAGQARQLGLRRLTLEEMAALLEAAPLLIANNSGPAHLAAAVGTPVVSLYALTNPQHTPWGVPTRVLSRAVPCHGCLKSVCPELHNECIRGVTPGEVVEAALSLLEETRGGVQASSRVPALP